MIRDIRFALRGLRKSKGFAIAAILTLALGIGANSAIFSAVNAVLLKPLPYKDPQQLTIVYNTAPGGVQQFVSQPDLDDWRSSARSFSGLASLAPQSVNITGGDQPDRVVGSFVSANYFDVLAVQPAFGRFFSPGEDRRGAALVAVLTDRLWHGHFGGDPTIVGRKILFNGEPYTVIGVLRPDYVDQPWNADVYLPAFKYPNYSLDRGRAIGAVIGRLRPGISIGEAQSEMTTIAARLSTAYPATNRDHGAQVVAMKELVVRQLRPMILALAGAVGFVLLIACANVAGLFAARLVSRERESVVRAALGAGRMQLISPVLAEALILAALGGTAGCAIASWTIQALASGLANQLPPGVRLTIDAPVLAFTAVVALLSALLIAALPAWQSTSVSVLREGRGVVRGRSRNVLAAAEIAMSMVLLTGAGLTLKSLVELGRAHTGFNPQNLITFEYRVPLAKYKTGAEQNEFHRQVVEQIRSIPGVISAAAVRAVPLGGNGELDEFSLPGRAETSAATRPRAIFNAADPYFFDTLGIPLLRGRVFNEHDTAGSAKVFVINQTLASRYFGDRDPIGQTIRVVTYQGSIEAQVIGVVGDVKQFTAEDLPTPQIYGSLAQNPFVFVSIAIRTAADPSAMMNEIRRAVWRVDKDQPMWGMRTVNAALGKLAQPREFMSSLLGGYATLALLLAAIGIFGVISYSVTQRTAEIGIRIALGANPADVAAMILRQGLRIVAAGIGVGIVAAAPLARLLRQQLYAVSPLDLSVYAIVAGVLAAVAMAACLIPARRAMRLDPVDALRHD